MKQCELDMLLSLYESILQSGGNPKAILVEGLTVRELIEQIAPNGIRFTFDEDAQL